MSSDPASPDSPAAAAAAPTKKKPLPPRTERRGVERAPMPFVDQRRRLWTRLDPEYTLTPRYLPFEGHWVHYVDEGPRDGEVLLLVHGNPTWSFYWRRLIEGLRDRYRVVSIDLLGMGFSEKPADFDYRLQRHTDVLEHLVDELRLPRLTLGMHDWGGAIGMGFARRRPDLIERLVVTNTAAFTGLEMPRLIAMARSRFPGSFLVRRLGLFTRLALRTTLHRRKGDLSKLERLAYSAPYRSHADRVAIDAFVKDIPTDPSHPSWDELTATGEALAQFQDRPTLIAWGMRDFVFKGAFLEEWIRRFPEAQVQRFDDCGHWLMEDAPDELTRLVGEFIAAHPVAAEAAADGAEA